MDEYHQQLYEGFLRYLETTKSLQKFNTNLSTPAYQGLNATPLGLCSFALTTFVASMYLCGISVPVDASIGVVMGLALFYGGATQLLAGFLSFREGNTFGAVAFSSYGGFWLSFGAIHIAAFNFLVGYKDISVLNNALGVFFLSWAIFTGLMTLSCLRTNLITIGLFFSLFLCFVLLSSSKFLQSHQNLQRASGAFGLLSATFAWYSAFAHLLNKSDWFFKLPLFEILHKKHEEASIILTQL
ncbi:unnamed protein product [Rotaria sordida]|uniref:Uncharacterized protein n=1 Tax=Rotaria sordida TaxID=392033 RepID=A0A815P1E1_9BILA|nr:unnamed protein product [Rotaria sordida]CAF3822095.1 unnamed protein product [Rotaria sordida]